MSSIITIHHAATTSGAYCLEGIALKRKSGSGLMHQMLYNHKIYIDNAAVDPRLSRPPPELPDLDDEEGLG